MINLNLMGQGMQSEAKPVLYGLLGHLELAREVDFGSLDYYPGIETTEVVHPFEGGLFRHECAIAAYKGILFASWYSNPVHELTGETSIFFSRSCDGGKSWEEPILVATDPEAKILYCPPVFAVSEGKLWLFLNQMVSPDHIHSLDLYLYDEFANRFVAVWSRPIPFKLNTNVYPHPNGGFFMPGRCGEIDGFPNTPAILMSDSVGGEWSIAKIAPDGSLPDGTKYLHPEISAIVSGKEAYLFCRNDASNAPLVYRGDFSAPWTLLTHDIPFVDSKIYSGTLSCGRNYLIGNIMPKSGAKRSRLAVFFSEPGCVLFRKGYLIQNGFSRDLGYGGEQWSYPCAVEDGGMLHVIYSGAVDRCENRAAVHSSLPLDAIR